MSEYKELSHITNHRVIPETWEVIPLEKVQQDTPKKVQQIIETRQNENTIYLARQIAWKYGENLIRQLLKKMAFNQNKIIDKNFDFLLKSGEFCEVKTGRIGNCCVLIEDQLSKMPVWGYYFLVYYNISEFQNGSQCLEYAKEKLKISPESYLKQKIQVQSIYIFPKSDIVWFYNNHPRKQRKIQSTKGKARTFEYAPIKNNQANQLFWENPWNHEKTTFTFWTEESKSISVYVLWLDIKL